MDRTTAKHSLTAGSGSSGGYLVIWEFLVRQELRPAFETAYAPDGDWARLFRQSSEYLGTELFHDLGLPERYLTLDRWTSRDAFLKFKQANESAYRTLDQQCDVLTQHEAMLGEWEPAGALGR
jgi:heme-degrading monooxygenase HmoA